ncbi:GntR family transcriptional regulator [Streptomyces cremeus]|uniref:GntR family transcriptional regulator n=1 Tax=Streptomyces cremeus TaxID=66881 RepID=A0ABV5PB11_STRCM
MATLKYEQIAEALRARISDGEFEPGALLPSGRDLADQWSVSRATVIKAMEVLRNDGLVAARAGAGFTVVETPVARPAGNRGAPSRIDGGMPFRRLGKPDWQVPPERVAEALGCRRSPRVGRSRDGTSPQAARHAARQQPLDPGHGMVSVRCGRSLSSPDG